MATLDFSTLSVLAATILALLGIGWLAKGGLMLARWGLQPHPTALLVGRRLGSVYLGFAILMFTMRDLPAGAVRSPLCWGLAALASCIAAVGLYEFLRKRTGPAMLASVAVELLLAWQFAASA